MMSRSAEAPKPDELGAELKALRDRLPADLRRRSQAIAAVPDCPCLPDWTRAPDHLTVHPHGEPRNKLVGIAGSTASPGHLHIQDAEDFTLDAESIKGICTLRFSRCRNFTIDLSEWKVDQDPDTRSKFSLHFHRCTGFALRNVVSNGGRNLALFDACDRFSVSDVTCSNYEGYGLTLFNSSFFSICRSHFDRNLASGILVLGDCHDGTIHEVEVAESFGYYNWDAGIHFCHCSRRISSDDIPERIHEALAIREKTVRPRRIRVSGCRFVKNRAQGIYLEGAQECVFDGNEILENNKEGICLDWGTSRCVLVGNRLSGNGQRARMTEKEISIDFIPDFPVLPDGSSSCKLPGLSFDNGVLNAVLNNIFIDNYGGGVKMVRSAIGNLISGNFFSNNFRGKNFHVKSIYDIYILSLGNRGGEFDDERESLLDFLSSSFNSFKKNQFERVFGESVHYGVEHNTFQDNVFSVSGASLPPDRPAVFELPVASQPNEVTPHTLYAFGNVTGRHLANVRLKGDGGIQFSPHDNESYWRSDQSELLFLDRQFKVTTRFFRFSDPSGHPVYIGSFRESGIMHYLVPILTTESRPSAERLPPCVINSLSPGTEARLLIDLLSKLGWCKIGIRCRMEAVEDRWHPSGGTTETPKGRPSGRQVNCSVPELISILRPGQIIFGHFPAAPRTDESPDFLSLIITTDLRTSFVRKFLRESGLNAVDNSDNMDDRDDSEIQSRLVDFMNANLSQYVVATQRRISHLADPLALTVRSEDLLAGEVPSALQQRLAFFHLSTTIVENALCNAEMKHSAASRQVAYPWLAWWSSTAEALFVTSGLSDINEGLGYPKSSLVIGNRG